MSTSRPELSDRQGRGALEERQLEATKMARLPRDQRSAVALAAALLGMLLSIPSVFSAGAQELYNHPVLTIDPGMHTAPIWTAAVDAEGRFAVTTSDDKTIRVWSVESGKLLQTIRAPAGPGDLGKMYALAMSPDSNFVAAAAYWAEMKEQDIPIYLFNWRTGEMIQRITSDEHVGGLAFSSDGRYLAAVLGFGAGLRIYDRDNKWSEAFRDTDYGWHSFGVAFANDGQLATTAWDGKVRLYGHNFRRVKQMTSGQQPMGIAFSPDGKVLAIGYSDVPAIVLLDTVTLTTRQPPSDLPTTGSLDKVAWSKDGETLFAAGIHVQNVPTETFVFAWADAGHGARRAISIGDDRVTSIVALAGDELLVATMDPRLAVLKGDGTPRWVRDNLVADFRGQQATLSVSSDGMIVDFDFGRHGKFPVRFDLHTLSIGGNRTNGGVTQPPKQDGLSIQNWENSASPTLGGNPIESLLGVSRSLAIHPDGKRFILGTSGALQALDAQGTLRWLRAVPQEPWAVNVTGDGRMVVAGYADGTIRWHHMDDGRELLALMVLADKQNWVAWTPEGFYAATPGAYGVLQWHVNHGIDRAGTAVPVSAIPNLRRPDAIPLVLQELETARALGIADMAAARHDVQVATGAANPPGTRLHVLTIGIDDYGTDGKRLHLDFASKDASDVFNALVNTQGGAFGLYAQVLPQYLHDEEATKDGIFDALDAMKRNMARDNTGDDIAVVMFSGHGAMVDGQWYLLPYGVNVATPSRIEATAIESRQLQRKLAELAKYGRVLALIDSCHSGAITANAEQIEPNVDLLRFALTASNVTVLTSSRGIEVSREDPQWNNSAFTKAVLESLGRAADKDNNGMISMSELTAYLSVRVPELTGGLQHVGIEQGFQRELFAAGL
jgi:DNA-binding beta-propeller fold protein YncE